MHLSDKQRMLQNLTAFLAGDTSNLRDHQREALETVRDFMALDTNGEFIQRGVEGSKETVQKLGDFFEVVSATGTGKTRMFGTMAKAMDVPTLILTPRNVLNDQTKAEFCDEIGIDPEKVAVYDSKQPVSERRRVLEGDHPPQFLITTYQSLPSLRNRHELDVTNPDDPHYRPLVILDEVHEGQGPVITSHLDLLRKDVLLAGFTATDAGASETIFNGQKPIFHLPIVPAIKRKLLCTGIRTGVIDVDLDEEWVKNFAKTPTGRNYSQQQIEKFSRAPSVTNGALDFHLGYVNENTGEVHPGFSDDELGEISRLPTVFYTQGVEAARIGAEAFNKRAQVMGLNAKAAYVSGDMKPEVYRPILEQFKRGEIQALWNDRLLGMGFDAPNATVCYSLQPSNLSYIVEQQLGRVARKQGEDYFEKYGQNKVALAINVRAQDMNPVLFAQILHSPSVYSDNVPRRSTAEANPWIGVGRSSFEWRHGIGVHIDYNDLLTVLADADKARDGPPFRTKEWLGKKEMAVRIRKDSKPVIALFDKAEAAWKQAKERSQSSFTVNDDNFGILTISIDHAGYFIGGNGRSMFCLHESVATQIGVPDYPPKTDKWLGVNEMSARLKKDNVPVSAFYDRAEAAWQLATGAKQDTFTVVDDKIGTWTIPVNQVGYFIGGNGRAIFCMNESVADLIGVSEEAPEKPDDWLTKMEMMAELRKRFPTVSAFYEKAEAAWTAATAAKQKTFRVVDDKIGDAQSYTFPIDHGAYFKVRGSSNRTFCLHKAVAEQIGATKDYPDKTAEWLSIMEMATRLKSYTAKVSPFYAAVLKKWRQAKEDEQDAFTITDNHFGTLNIPVNRAGYFKDAGRTPFCIHESIAEQIGIPDYREKTAEWLNTTNLSTLIGRRHERTISTIYNQAAAAWKQAKTDKHDSFTITVDKLGTLTIPMDKADYCKGPSRPVFCLHRDIAEIVGERLTGHSSGHADSVGQRSIGPDSEHINDSDSGVPGQGPS